MTGRRPAALNWAGSLIEQGNLLVGKAEAGQRRVTPTETDTSFCHRKVFIGRLSYTEGKSTGNFGSHRKLT